MDAYNHKHLIFLFWVITLLTTNEMALVADPYTLPVHTSYYFEHSKPVSVQCGRC